MNKLNILITGCGGDIGQSILKLLKTEPVTGKLVGTDIHDHHPGKFLCDLFCVVPRVTDPQYIPALSRIVAEQDIQLIIPVSEIELRKHAETGLFNIFASTGVIIVCPDSDTLTIGFDKLATARFLEEKGLPFPKTMPANEATPSKFPIILKDRFGSGSKTLQKVNNLMEYEFYSKQNISLLVQEMIPDTEGEYTCGLFCAGDITRTIVYKRTLQGGFSNYGIKVNNQAINAFLFQLAALLKPKGSINIQLRLKNGIPYVFEINPRFSSTVLFRHKMGFKDVLWSIFAATGKPVPEYNEAPDGSEFFKGYDEYISIP
ncbi:MAG: ATP-grasp domain-containing protein [Dinghuibacter sp.]|nr:ATP-grasp domain-containing protein [Dinghuibacter sp.]